MTSKEFNLIIHQSRAKELLLKKATLKKIINLLNNVSDNLEASIAQASIQGTLRKEQLVQMKARIEQDIDSFSGAYSQIVHSGIQDETQLIIDRNGRIFLEVEGTTKLLDTIQDSVLREILNLKEKDGLVLSDRIWKITEETKADIINHLQKGILLGESHTKIAHEIRQYIKGGGVKYKSERLVITEMAKAYKHANEISVDMMRQGSQYEWFEKWELSPAHSVPDVCDILATQNIEGEGPGVYKHSPNRHPGCYCYIYPVYRLKRTTGTYPSVSNVEPQTEDLDKSQTKLAKELT